MPTRRRFLKVGSAAGAGLYCFTRFGTPVFSQIGGGTLAPNRIAKFVTPLLIPPAMPVAGTDAVADYYTIGVRQFAQRILPAPHPPTTVWGYGSLTDARTFSYPSFTIETIADRRAHVSWVNQLVNGRGRYLPHLLPVDQTLHWANPPGGVDGRDRQGLDPKPYRGPVPFVTHLHGGHTSDESDGFPEAWYLPAAIDIPADYALTGTWYEYFRTKFAARWGGTWAPGSATFVYENDQRAATLWYHDHSLGMTRVNVYAGPAGFYLIRGGAGDLPAGVLPGPAPALDDPPGTRYYEIPIVIQDRSFNADGSLFYPDNRAFFEGLRTGQLRIPFVPDTACTGPSDVPPIWNPEFFGNTVVVNGSTWPYLEVEQRRYRFRFLNGCNSRFLILKLSTEGMPFWQIGADGGFLSAPAMLEHLLMGPAERADVIVDFTNAAIGTAITLLNVGPDEPFGGGTPDDDFDAADPSTTGLVMQFRVIAARSIDTSTPPDELSLPARSPVPVESATRSVSLNEAESATVLVDGHPGHGHPDRAPTILRLACGDPAAVPFGPTMAMLGTVTEDDEGNPMRWMDAASETPAPGATEVWNIFNFTEDAHPIHIHMVQFEIVGRHDADGNPRPPEAWETGTKDTVISYPGEVTQVKATFDREGLFVWHCHILEHEDNEMMRPYVVGLPPDPTAPFEK